MDVNCWFNYNVDSIIMSVWSKIEPNQYPDFKCKYCGENKNLVYYLWESSDGAYEDYHYKCDDCGKDWWVEGADY